MEIINGYSHKIITLDEMAKKAPSIFAKNPEPGVSDKYKFIPTETVVDLLMDKGWQPTFANQSRSRKANGADYAKHVIRFRHADYLSENGFKATVGDMVPELVLYNSHNRTSAFKLIAGLFRCICNNQMVVADTTLQSASVRHVGFQDSKILEAQYRILEDFPKLTHQVEQFSELELTKREQEAFADSALQLRWDADKAPVKGEILNRARRNADKGDSLWLTMNRVQENIIQGGQRGLKRNERGRISRTTSRAIKSVDKDKKLNTALWTLAEEMQKIKLAA